jgi:hypothetical protein
MKFTPVTDYQALFNTTFRLPGVGEPNCFARLAFSIATDEFCWSSFGFG